MRKEEYLRKLDQGLKGFSVEVRKDILADIREHFEMREQEGVSEDETSERLGDPRKLAKQFEVTTKIEKAKDTKKGRDITAAVLSAAGTGMLAFFGVVIPSIIGYALFIALILVSVGVMAGGVASLVYAIIYLAYLPLNVSAVAILLSTGLITLGILMIIASIAMFRLIKKGILGTLDYIRKH